MPYAWTLAAVGALATLGCAPSAHAEQGGTTAGAVANPVVYACEQFDAALSLAARLYDDFAYASAGTGDEVNYDDPEVSRSNTVGRTALREAARAAFGISRTPGLPPELVDPMRSWSLHATKLLVVMGVRGGGGTLNATAEQLNADAREVERVCAAQSGGL